MERVFKQTVLAINSTQVLKKNNCLLNDKTGKPDCQKKILFSFFLSSDAKRSRVSERRSESKSFLVFSCVVHNNTYMCSSEPSQTKCRSPNTGVWVSRWANIPPCTSTRWSGRTSCRPHGKYGREWVLLGYCTAPLGDGGEKRQGEGQRWEIVLAFFFIFFQISGSQVEDQELETRSDHGFWRSQGA